MQKREKRTRIYPSLNDEGVAALDLLRMSSNGASESDIVNAALCKQASRINAETRARLEAIAARRDGETVRQLRKDNERLHQEMESSREMTRAMLAEFSDMAALMRRLNKPAKGSVDDDAT